MSWQSKIPRLLRCVDIFLSKYPSHKGKIIINGDASGDYKRVENEFTNYIILKNKLEAFGYVILSLTSALLTLPLRIVLPHWNSKIRNVTGELNIYVSPRCKWLIYNCYNLKYKEGTSIIDLPSHYRLKNDRNSRFLGHFFDSASYPVEFYHPIMVGKA